MTRAIVRASIDSFFARPVGAKGERGIRGEPGSEAARIVGWHINEESYVATAVMSDGTIAG
jgi:hypothetical protein